MDRKEEIIYAALALASERGLKGLSMTRIAGRVGMKAPSLYNHFKSKDEIVRAMYSCLREKAQKGRPSAWPGPEALASKSLEQLLTDALSAYLEMISDGNILQFFRVLYSERSTDPLAAQILVEETEHMLRSTSTLFYALAVHGKIKADGVDMAAMTFALTVHALVDDRMDRITAGLAEQFGEADRPYTKELIAFVRWFSAQMGGAQHEAETD